MEVDKRLEGNKRYVEEGIKTYNAYEKVRNEKNVGKGIFTQATVEKVTGYER